MTIGQPNILVPREGETGLLWAIVVSGAVHAAAIVMVIVVPGYWKLRPVPAVSYTVDLVASAEPAGTNLPAGRAHPKPVLPSSPPQPVAKPPEVPEVKEPEAIEPQSQAVEPKPQVVEPAPPKAPPPPVIPEQPAVPKGEPAPAQKADLKLASKTVQPTIPKAKPAEPTPALARATAPAVKPTAAVARATAAAVKSTAVVAQKPTPVAAQTAAAAKAASDREAREKQIASAIERRVQDQRIADAVQRRADAARQHGPSAGAEGTARGGPISIGQGTGSGGVVEGLDMILYRGQMERRIKENWVWAGEDPSLEVKVRFDVTAKGEIQNVRVTGSSGNRSYDASAERAVRAASPLAPPPEKYRDLFVHGVEITFRPQDLQS